MCTPFGSFFVKNYRSLKGNKLQCSQCSYNTVTMNKMRRHVEGSKKKFYFHQTDFAVKNKIKMNN